MFFLLKLLNFTYIFFLYFILRHLPAEPRVAVTHPLVQESRTTETVFLLTPLLLLSFPLSWLPPWLSCFNHLPWILNLIVCFILLLHFLLVTMACFFLFYHIWFSSILYVKEFLPPFSFLLKSSYLLVTNSWLTLKTGRWLFCPFFHHLYIFSSLFILSDTRYRN